MKRQLAAFAARLREPSTAAGLAALGVLFGLPPGTLDLALQVVIGAAGLAAVLLPEHADKGPPGGA